MPDTTHQTAAIILAAGSSSRMGRSKQMLDIGGEPLLVRTWRIVRAAGVDDPVVVLGAEEEAHRKMLAPLAASIVTNPQWMEGMGTSIASGMQYLLQKESSPDCVLILVCDQPLLRSDHLRTLIGRYSRAGRQIVASYYAKAPGVPALFGSKYFGQLSQLPGTQGAKKIMLENTADLEKVEFPEGITDLDTWEDYEAFLKTTP